MILKCTSTCYLPMTQYEVVITLILRHQIYLRAANILKLKLLNIL